jgi:transposase
MCGRAGSQRIRKFSKKLVAKFDNSPPNRRKSRSEHPQQFLLDLQAWKKRSKDRRKSLAEVGRPYGIGLERAKTAVASLSKLLAKQSVAKADSCLRSATVHRQLQLRKKLTVSKKLIFVQDGARAHASKDVKKYLLRKGVDFIDDWPPYSPDLNCIESLWKDYKEAVGAYCPMTRDELLVAAKKAWDELPQSLIDRHVMSFKSRLNKCINTL